MFQAIFDYFLFLFHRPVGNNPPLHARPEPRLVLQFVEAGTMNRKKNNYLSGWAQLEPKADKTNWRYFSTTCPGNAQGRPGKFVTFAPKTGSRETVGERCQMDNLDAACAAPFVPQIKRLPDE